MAIQDDFSIDVVNSRISYTTAFVDDRPPNIYTVNELYSWLQDTFDEPSYMQYPVPMSAQTPTQYTIINAWFIDDNSVKALYGGSIQTDGWTKSGAAGITQVRWVTGSSDPPAVADIGVSLSGTTSAATGTLLAVDLGRQVAWIRNVSTEQFIDNELVQGDGVNMQLEVMTGSASGETIWSNLFSVGSLQSYSEIYIGQEDDYMGGRSFHTSASWGRRIEKVDEWWDSDVDFTASPNLLGGLGHFDVLVKTQEAGNVIDGGRLAVFSRQFSKVYSHFELVGGNGNFVVPFASTGADLNSSEGPYSASFVNRTGADLEIGDVLENVAPSLPAGRLRAVVTDVTDGGLSTGTLQFYLIGENQPSGSFERTLNQFTASWTDLAVRGDTTLLTISGSTVGTVSTGPADAQGITVTFADTQVDVDEDSVTEEYACTINCNNRPLANVYKRMMFLTSQGNQDGTTSDRQDLLLPSNVAWNKEAGEFYRAVGDIVFNYDGGTGTQITEGDSVTNSGGTASGVVVSVTAGTTGVCVLTQVKGTFSDGDIVARRGEHGSNYITVNETATGAARSIVDNNAAPFGAFAGGRWFVARGIVLTNVPTADANNWETVDLAGTRRAPPTVRTVTFAGLVANDRAVILEVDTAGQRDYTKNQNGIGAGGASPGDTSLTLDTTPSLDVPTSGWIRVVDTSLATTTGDEYRYEYSSWSGTTVTLRAVSPGDDVCDAGGSSTVLVDVGIATSFGTDGYPKVGMLVRNTTSGGWARVLRRIDDDSVETTPLTTGTWATGNGYLLNVVVVALLDEDTAYFPFIDDTAITTSISKLVKYVSNKNLLARVRFSDPDVGGTRIQPFELTGVTLTDANLTVTAIRTTDTIASP
jgi:hypothetical protein